jgi:outer membrane protein assembly factor BamB
MPKPSTFILIFAIVCIAASPVLAQWDQWRGPYRDGIVRQVEAPSVWPDSLRLVWSVEVGEGQATPVVDDERIYLFTRTGEHQGITCLDRASAATLWRSEESVRFDIVHRDAYKMGQGPKSTPLLHKRRLYALDIDGRLSAYEAKDGRVLWRRSFADEFENSSLYFGASTSPLIAGGLLIVHVGGNDSGALRAFDLDSGQTLWSWNEPPSHASPIVVEIGGIEQLVTQSQNLRAGIDLASGELLWSMPFTTPWDETTPTPVLYGEDLVIFSGLQRGMTAVRLARAEQVWQPEIVWHNQDGSSYLNSAVLGTATNSDRLLGHSHYNKGQFFCLEAATGEPLWFSRGRQGENAALLAWGSVWLVLGADGELLVLDQGGAAFAPLRRYTVAQSQTWAHPVVLPEGILIKEYDRLSLWSWN